MTTAKTGITDLSDKHKSNGFKTEAAKVGGSPLTLAPPFFLDLSRLIDGKLSLDSIISIVHFHTTFKNLKSAKFTPLYLLH